MIIKNYKELATTDLRRDALDIIDAGINAILPENALKEKIFLNGDLLKIGSHKINLSDFKNIYIIDFGKMSLKTAEFLDKLLGARITDGVVVDVQTKKLKHIKVFKGSHPCPSEENIKATEEIISILNNAGKNDLILTIVSGGGSALLCSPHNMTCSTLADINDMLLKCGANIKEINTVRKHLSEIHGGQVAKVAYPATVVSLIFSDIPFSDLSFVASGPTYFDETTKKDAEMIAKKYRLPDLPFVETPKNKKYFECVTNILVLDNKVALKAMVKKAEKLGYNAKILSATLRGGTKNVAEKIINNLSKKTVVIAGGEPVIKINKDGKGGRNMETVLRGADIISDNQLFLSFSSDGKDNIPGIGGALIDRESKNQQIQKEYDSRQFLEENKSYYFFKGVDTLIKSNPTGVNVSDLMIGIEEE